MASHMENELVAVIWEDATFCLESAESTYRVTTSGWLVRYAENYVTVASERIESDGQTVHRAFTSIPTRMVLSIEPLTMGE